MQPEPAPQIAPGRPILLIEDDDFEAKAVVRGFRKAGLGSAITRAKDGIEALHLLRSSMTCAALGQHPILLVDLNLPRMDGIEFLTELRADPDLRQLVAFVLTTSKDERDVLAAYKLRVAGYVVKSLAGPNYCNLVALLQNHAATVQQPPPDAGAADAAPSSP